MTLLGLARSSALYTVGFLLPRIGNLLLLPIYVRFLSPADFGAVALVTTVASVMAVVFRGGSDAALMRLHFQAPIPDRPRVYSTAVLTALGISLVAGLLAALLSAFFFERAFAGLPFAPFGALALAMGFTSTFHSFPSTLYRANEQPGRVVVYSTLTFLLTAAVTFALVVGAGMGAVGAIIGQLSGAAFGTFLAAVVLVRLGVRFDRDLAVAGLRFGLPLVPHALSGWLLNVSDRWLLGLLLSGSTASVRAEIGVYSFGYQLGFIVALLAQAFNSAWTPFFYRYGDAPEGPQIHRQMVSVATAGFAVIAVAVASAAPEIVALIARPQFAAAAAIVPLVAVGATLYTLYFMIVTVIFFSKRTAGLPALTGAAAVVNVASNILLVPLVGMTGAAWATVAGYGTMALLTFLYARRSYPIDLDLWRLAVLAVGATGAITAAALLGSDIGLMTTGGRFALAGAFALLALTLAAGPVRSLRSLAASANRGRHAATVHDDPASGSGKHGNDQVGGA